MVIAFWVGGRAAMETCSCEIRRGVGEVGPQRVKDCFDELKVATYRKALALA